MRVVCGWLARLGMYEQRYKTKGVRDMNTWNKLNPKIKLDAMKYPADERKSSCKLVNEKHHPGIRLSSFDSGMASDTSTLDFYFNVVRLDSGYPYWVPLRRWYDNDLKEVVYVFGNMEDNWNIKRPYRQRFKTAAGLIRFIHDFYAEGTNLVHGSIPIKVVGVRLQYGRMTYEAELQG